MKGFNFIVALLIAINSYGQTDHRYNAFLSLQANKTLSDRTITNNTGGAGLGFQASLNTKTWIRPYLEINRDFFAGTKEQNLTPDNKLIYAKSTIASVYMGPQLEPVARLLIATTFGLNFYNGTTNFGIRPSIGFFLSKNKGSAAILSLTNVYQHDNISNESFRYVSFALSIRMW